MEKVGPVMSDIGSPCGPGASLVDDGSIGSAASLTGYSIVEAADIERHGRWRQVIPTSARERATTPSTSSS
jgi:hypothetical protein